MADSTRRTLLLAFLTVSSSYIARREQPSTGVPDTVQFWIEDTGVWRVRTYALDHDIHIHHLNGMVESETKPRLPMLQAHLERVYPDVLGPIHVLEFEDYTDPDTIAATLTAAGLNSKLDDAEAGFYFYNPDGGQYQSQSEPA